MNAKELRLAQMDAVLQDAASHPLPPRPPAGWLRAIREALGMTSGVLAERLGVTASGARKLEQAEAVDAITLGTLRRVAEALDCDLQYALVPRRPRRPAFARLTPAPSHGRPRSPANPDRQACSALARASGRRPRMQATPPPGQVPSRAAGPSALPPLRPANIMPACSAGPAHVPGTR